ncbi:unnamed protein product [Linum trigynum]|uniref:Uncharacterized protein n=1 Tax=Linum trigynum TaxID=586398 RepID=A0AAV2GBX2_9ROSI
MHALTNSPPSETSPNVHANHTYFCMVPVRVLHLCNHLQAVTLEDWPVHFQARHHLHTQLPASASAISTLKVPFIRFATASTNFP